MWEKINIYKKISSVIGIFMLKLSETSRECQAEGVSDKRTIEQKVQKDDDTKLIKKQ